MTASYDGQDRLTQAGGTSYTSTLNGERQSKTISGQTTTYAYDTRSDLVQVSLPAGTQLQYLVDGRGLWVGKLVNGVRVQGWLYDERGRLVAELDGANAVVSRFVYAVRGERAVVHGAGRIHLPHPR